MDIENTSLFRNDDGDELTLTCNPGGLHAFQIETDGKTWGLDLEGLDYLHSFVNTARYHKFMSAQAAADGDDE